MQPPPKIVLICASTPFIVEFCGFWPIVKSVTCVFSIASRGANPTLSASTFSYFYLQYLTGPTRLGSRSVCSSASVP